MSKSTRPEFYRHENDDGPPGLGERDPGPYPRLALPRSGQRSLPGPLVRRRPSRSGSARPRQRRSWARLREPPGPPPRSTGGRAPRGAPSTGRLPFRGAHLPLGLQGDAVRPARADALCLALARAPPARPAPKPPARRKPRRPPRRACPAACQGAGQAACPRHRPSRPPNPRAKPPAKPPGQISRR